MLYGESSSMPPSHGTRVARFLAQNLASNIQLSIIDAGKSNEGMPNALKKYIVYTIRLVLLSDPEHDIQIRRRYSDFESLRDILTRVFSLVMIPPIPPKNYFSLHALNDLVTLSNSADPQRASGTDSPPYSYINLSYLNKSRLIEHRKRLLTNFLNNCVSLPQIRRLDFFAKFLDPSSNWTDEVSLITSHLPKSVYQLNPENGLNTDPLYANLPISSSNHSMGLLKHLPTSLFKKQEDLLPQNEPEMPLPIVQNSSLDHINKKVLTNLAALGQDYIELGNLFGALPALIDQDNKLCLDKIGQVFDSSAIMINGLIADLETKYSEPLGEAVKYTTVFEATQRFRRKKEKQKRWIDDDLTEKRKELADGLRAEMEITRIEKGLRAQSLNSPGKFDLSQQPQVMEKTSRNRFLPSNPVKKFTKYVSGMMDQNPDLTRRQRISQLQERIAIMEKCQVIMLQDLSYIADELAKNAARFHKNELKAMFQLLLNYNSIFVAWAKKNVELWEEVREHIN